MEITENDLRVNTGSKQILSIALPITIAILIPQINMLTNNIFLGHFDKRALGNAGITGVYYLIFAVAGHGLNNAMQSVFSRRAGSGNTHEFTTILSQGIRISLQFAAVGILFTWFAAPLILQNIAAPEDYPQEISFLKLRIWGLPFLYLFQMGNAFLVASLNSRLLIIGFLIEAGLNIFLDWLLIFGNWGFPAMGFNGAALASVIAECVGMLVTLLVIVQKGFKRKYNLLENLRYNKSINKEVLNISVPLVLQFVISVTTWLVFFLLIEDKGVEAKGISNVMRNVFGLSGIFVWAFAATTNTMVSNLIGQGRQDEVLLLVKRIMLWSAGFCSISCIVINIFPALLFSVFTEDAGFVKDVIPVARIVSLGLLSMSIANIWLNSVTGTGKTKINLVIEITAIVAYLAYTLYFMKVNYISLSMAWSNELVYWAVIFSMSFWFMKSGKWKK